MSSRAASTRLDSSVPEGAVVHGRRGRRGGADAPTECKPHHCAVSRPAWPAVLLWRKRLFIHIVCNCAASDAGAPAAPAPAPPVKSGGWGDEGGDAGGSEGKQSTAPFSVHYYAHNIISVTSPSSRVKLLCMRPSSLHDFEPRTPVSVFSLLMNASPPP